MTTFNVTDSETNKTLTITAENMNIALDIAASELGFIDYQDLMQERGWDSEEDEGLDIVEAYK